MGGDVYIPEFGIATMKSWASKRVRMCGKIAHLVLMVLKQNWWRAHRSVAWESVGRAVWRKCRPSSSPSTPESEAAFYQAGSPTAPRGLCQVTWCLTLVVGHLLTHPALWLNSSTSMSPFTHPALSLNSCTSMSTFNPETGLLKQAFIEAQKSCYWGLQRYHEKTVSGSVFPKGEIGKLRPQPVKVQPGQAQ